MIETLPGVGESVLVARLVLAYLISRREADVRDSLVYTYRLATKCLETKVAFVFREIVVCQLAANTLAYSRLVVGERRCTKRIADVLKIRVSTSKMELQLELGMGQVPALWVQLMRAYSPHISVHESHRGGNWQEPPKMVIECSFRVQELVLAPRQ